MWGFSGPQQSARSPLLAAAPHPSRLLRIRQRPLGWGGGGEKMVIVVRKDLGMGAGKIAAQAAHAAVELYQKYCKRPGVCNRWYNTGAKKVVLRVESEAELDRIAAQARKHGLPVAVITDQGLTQVRKGTKTAVSILGAGQKINAVTGSLRTL